MVSELLDKYLWLMQTLVDAGERGLSLEEITSRWTARYGAPYPRRTFNNHRTAISDLFGIEILCDRSTNRYRMDEFAVDTRQSIDWLVNTFTVNSLLSSGKERLSGRVSVEDIPSGHRFLTRIMEAMLDNKVIRISYRKYSGSRPETLHVHPYAVKEFAKRWYLTGFCRERGGVRVYGLDRIGEADVLDETFKMPRGYDVNDEFKFSYGPYRPDGLKPRIIRLKAYGTEAAYLQDLPLHPSQTLVESGDGYSVFRLYLIPTRNFTMDLCKFGPGVEILETQTLKDAVTAQLQQTLDLYKKH